MQRSRSIVYGCNVPATPIRSMPCALSQTHLGTSGTVSLMLGVE